MEFRFTEELEMIRTAVREFAEKEVAPTARNRDEREQFDQEVFEGMAGMGLTGVLWPEQYGGTGGDCLTYAVALEEVAKACAAASTVLASHVGYCGWPVFQFGSDEQKKAVLQPLAEGTMRGACCFPNASVVTAEENAGGFVLNGSSMHVIEAQSADLYIVFAEAMGRKDWNTFIVEGGTPGLTVGRRQRRLGLRSAAEFEVKFEDCRIPKKNRLAGNGYDMAVSVLELGNISAAAQAVGIAQAGLDAAAAYAKERRQFGKPIGHQQGISFKLADMAVKVEAARLLVCQAAWRKDAGLPCGKEAGIARRFACDSAIAATVEAVQVFGGYGYMKEYNVERYMRDAICIAADEGTERMRSDDLFRMLADRD